jgi:hypothetical protein
MRVLGLLVLVACANHTEKHIVDSSGAPFIWACNYGSPEPCHLEIDAQTPAPAPCPFGSADYAWALGRFIEVLSVCVTDTGWASASNLSRPLACGSAGDCPLFEGWKFECRNGLCQNADTAAYPPLFVNWTIADTLCYAPFAREDTFVLGPVGLQVSEAVGSVCSSTNDAVPCTLPLPSICWQI